MKIQLTSEQLEDVQKRLDEVLGEESDLREKQKTEHVNGWDFVALSNEAINLKSILKSGVVDTNDLY